MLSSLSPVLLLIRSLYLSVLYSGCDVLSPYAAEHCLRRAALKDRKAIRLIVDELRR